MRLDDISHFRRVWATAQRLAEDTDADRLMILTACYFHDIVSLAKTILSVAALLRWRGKRWLSSSQLSLISPSTAYAAVYTLLKRQF